MFEEVDMKIVNTFHVLVVGSVLSAIGVLGEDTPIYVYYFLLFLAMSIVLVVPFPSFARDSTNIIRAAHYVAMMPFLLFISYLGITSKSLSSQTYDVYSAVGGFVIVYHLYKLTKRMLY